MYDSDAPGGESEGCVALVPSASLLHFEPEAVHKLNYSDFFSVRLQAKPQKGEEGYDPDAPGCEDSGVALVPSAPPLHCDLEAVLAGAGDLLSLEPPTWTPDSHAGDCMACHQPFR